MMGKTIISLVAAVLAALTVMRSASAQEAKPEEPAPATEATAPAPETEPAAPALAKNAPSRYVVVKGDTLWDIAARFLRDPWRWPDIWGLNRDQIRNPHWIYPGDVIVLDISGQRPRLRFEGDADWKLLTARLSPKIRTQNLPPSAIPSIPAANLNAFLSKPLVVGEHELSGAPQIVAAQENRVVLGPGDVAFAKGLDLAGGSHYNVVRPGRKLSDPDTKEVLGNEAIYLGEVNVQEFGPVSTLKISRAVQEITPGDRLVDAPPISTAPYMPHGPSVMIRGKIIAASNESVSEIGPQSVVVLNRGARDGLEMGHVLAILRVGEVVKAARSSAGSASVKLPDERYGIVFVFRVFERLSYALVMNTTRPVHLYDLVQTP